MMGRCSRANRPVEKWTASSAATLRRDATLVGRAAKLPGGCLGMRFQALFINVFPEHGLKCAAGVVGILFVVFAACSDLAGVVASLASGFPLVHPFSVPAQVTVMRTSDGARDGELSPREGRRGASSLDQLAAWSIDTQAFVRKLGDIYRRWSVRPPNSPGQRRTFERTLRDLVGDAESLEARLGSIGNGLPDYRHNHGNSDDDRVAGEVYEQLVATRFLDAWRLMTRLLERQVVEIQEPKTAAEWRTYFRRFDNVWKAAQDLGKAARAVQVMLEESGLATLSSSESFEVTTQTDYQKMLLGEISSTCGDLVAFLVAEKILRENGGPPTPSKDIVAKHGTGGGSGIERVRPLTERLEGYLDLVDRLIASLTESTFLRGDGDAERIVLRLRSELRRLLVDATFRYETANNVLHAVLQMVDPVFVAPREALGHAGEARDVLRDLALQDRAFGRAVDRLERAAVLQLQGARTWSNLDEVERAIISYLRRYPDSTREDVGSGMPRVSPATVWRRLKRLRLEGLVESLPRVPTDGDRGEGRVTRPPAGTGGIADKGRGGSAPFRFRLTELGEGLGPTATGA